MTMPLPPLSVTLSTGQQIEALKRFRNKYAEELTAVEAEMQDILLSCAESEFMAKYLGDQPEVVELRARKAELDAKEKRRQYLGMIVERLDAVLPKQAAVVVSPPAGGGSASSKPAAGLKRY